MTGAPGRPTADRGPGVPFPPPTLLAIGFLAGWLLHRVRPLALVPGARVPALVVAGWVLILAGLSFTFWGMLTFARARTSIMPNRPASRVVTGGPYRFSRNPMYVGLTAAYLGLSVLANSAWPIIFLPIAIALLTSLVIRREEQYLARAFGADYDEYARRVRRWL